MEYDEKVDPPPSYEDTSHTGGGTGKPSGAGMSGIKPDMNYIRTIPAILKAVEFMLFMFAFGLAASYKNNVDDILGHAASSISDYIYNSSRIGFFLFVMVFSWMCTIALFVMYFMRVIDMLRTRIRFVSVILVAIHAAGVLFILLAVALVLDDCRRVRGYPNVCDSVGDYTSTSCGTYEAGGAFGFFCLVAVAGDTVLHVYKYIQEVRGGPSGPPAGAV